MKNIGERIRELRKAKKMTLKEISEKTGLSISFISQVETSKCSITLESLRKISEVLLVNPSYFFSNGADHSLDGNIAVHKKSIDDATEKIVNFTYKDLSGKFPNQLFLPTLVTLQPRNEGVRPHAHKGQEFVFVLEGTLTIIFEHTEVALHAGESIHMESTIPHNWVNRTEEAIKFLYVSAY